ncbi:uncharacterized protein LOC125499813 [Athalia rosae]|uniref:uncharacterized protein LOC125499813 n=1 Tax=Athalia rosae TaxID=37344 RepID=UPI00203486FA|nr:uncharacterized protein LOC125499813 [Athalia rosae]
MKTKRLDETYCEWITDKTYFQIHIFCVHMSSQHPSLHSVFPLIIYPMFSSMENRNSFELTNDLVQPPEVGISNIRRPKHDPTLPRKPIVPKDNIGFSGCHLQKPSNQPIGSRAPSATYNMKKVSRASDEGKGSSQMSLTHSSFWGNSTRNKSLKAAKVPGVAKGAENADER